MPEKKADLDFVRYFRVEAGVCWRCIFILFRENDDLSLYRSHERIDELDRKLLQIDTGAQ